MEIPREKRILKFPMRTVAKLIANEEDPSNRGLNVITDIGTAGRWRWFAYNMENLEASGPINGFISELDAQCHAFGILNGGHKLAFYNMDREVTMYPAMHSSKRTIWDGVRKFIFWR